MTIRPAIALTLGLIWACARTPAAPGTSASAPYANLLGNFRDDYGSAYSISPGLWFQAPRSRYQIVAWHPEQHYLVAQNDRNNPSGGGLWTRIDWIVLRDMAPYTWAFCLSAYEAPSREAADSSSVARPDTPKTGCNGFPFTRMRAAQPGEATPAAPY
jgi:hypothetical protein